MKKLVLLAGQSNMSGRGYLTENDIFEIPALTALRWDKVWIPAVDPYNYDRINLLGLNESTISRAVAGKSVRTPRGVFPLKYFFSSGFKSDDGGDVASRAVQEKIRELVAGEDPKNPLSDDKIAQLLVKDGVNVARRTIAKYRDILKIPSTRLRKKY